MLVVGFTILLAGLVGYIIGSTPDKFGNQSLTNQSSNPTQSSNKNSTSDSTDKIETGELPTIDSLLVTPQTTPLPLSLRAGIFFDGPSAAASAQEITGYGYPATPQKFVARDKTVLHLVVLAPFNNEANLQLAKYELFKKHDIVTRRIITPVEKK